ncbi:MAG: Gfo/Idh/MocA family oxidoreductase [Phenylobacterium sp.]
MDSILRGGVVGAGVFGGHHARKYASLPGAALAGIYDPHHPQRARELAEGLGGRAFDDLASLIAASDVVTVASPATLHAEQALAVLCAGKPVYVEKPIGVALEDANRLVAEAARRGLPLAVGHQQRVVFQAMGLFDIPEAPLRLEALRHGPPSPRSLDVSVVLDLMVHDLDLALALSDARPVKTVAEGRFDAQRGWDTARAEVEFEGGFIAVFDASRTADAFNRTMRIVYPSGEVEVDFLTHAFRNTTPFALNPDYEDTPAAKDQLAASVEGFLMAVRGQSPRPVVTGAEGARALDLALAIEAALEAARQRV